MATIKSFTSVEQSRKLAKILPIETADMYWIKRYMTFTESKYEVFVIDKSNKYIDFFKSHLISVENKDIIPCWSLSALLDYMNRKGYNISLECSGSKYTISFSDGNLYKTIIKDYAIDAAFEMVIWLNRLKEIIKAYIGSRDNVYEYVIRKLIEDVEEEF